MKSTEAFDIRVFVTKPNESSLQRRSLITEVSQESNLSLVNLETLFRRGDLILECLLPNPMNHHYKGEV